MRTDRELLADALKAFDEIRMVETRDYWDLMDEIRARLAEPEPDEPYPMCFWDGDDKPGSVRFDKQTERHKHPLYTRFQLTRPVRLSDEEILRWAAMYGTSQTLERPTYTLEDGEPTGDTYPQTDWEFGQEDLLGFARELLEKNQ